MFIKYLKVLFFFIFLLSFKITSAQQLSLKACDSIPSLKIKNACIFKVYNQSQKLLNKSYKSLLNKLDKKINASKLVDKKKMISLKQFFKDSQINWLLTRDYNAKTHAAYKLTTLQAENAFYYSKTSESIDRLIFFKTFADSLNIK